MGECLPIEVCPHGGRAYRQNYTIRGGEIKRGRFSKFVDCQNGRGEVGDGACDLFILFFGADLVDE